jgi:hypothetical protein
VLPSADVDSIDVAALLVLALRPCQAMLRLCYYAGAILLFVWSHAVITLEALLTCRCHVECHVIFHVHCRYVEAMLPLMLMSG